MNWAWTCLVFLCIPVYSQITGIVEGQVTDPAGQTISAASVRLENAITGFAQTAATDGEGRFQFGNVPHNVYRMAVSAAGFRTATREVSARTGLRTAVEVRMELAGQNTVVEISANDSAAVINPELTGTRTEINMNLIEKMPVSPASRGLEGVLLTMPGFAANANGAIHPRGAHNQMTFVVDGMSISDQLTGAFANAVDPSVVETLDLYTGNVPAEFGAKVSGVAVLTTRSGLGSGRKFGGSTQITGAGYGTLGSLTEFRGGGQRWGYFGSFHAVKSNRYLDSVSLDNLHNGGNAERAFARFDWQPRDRTSLRWNLMAGRSSFQLANLRSQHANGQSQRQELRDAAISAAWMETLDPRTTFEVLGSFRNAFADLLPSAGDTPISAAQSRRLTTWNSGVRVNHIRGRHTFRAGGDVNIFPVREHFSFLVTDPNYKVQHAGWFRFSAQDTGRLVSGWAQDQIRMGRLTLSIGMRYDHYSFLVKGVQWQPRVGLSFHLKETGTVFRASYNRNFQTPPNENLLLSNSAEAAAVAGGSLVRIQPERQNVFEGGIQQRLTKLVSLDAAFYHKNSRDLQDNDNFLNTGIIFPITLARSRVNGAEGRVMIAPGRRWSGIVSFTHYRAIVTPPFSGGLFLGSTAVDSLSQGPFIIDHDQTLGMQATTVYNFTRSFWVSGSVRYDSGLVSNPSDPETVKSDPDYSDLLPYVNLASNPTRVRPRTITDLAAGYVHMRGDRRQWEIVGYLNNAGNVTALYNFQSIFVGTRVVPPRITGLRLRWYF